MDLKKLVSGAVVIALGAVLFTGCASDPAEKADALTTSFITLQDKGAQVFAQVEYDQVSAKMAELANLREQKKYKEATALADSIDAAMQVLSAALETNGAQMAQQEAASVGEEITMFKAAVDANKKDLVADDAQKYADQATALETQAAGLQSELDSQNFLSAYNTAKSIKDQVAVSTQEITVKIEEAKAAKKGRK